LDGVIRTRVGYSGGTTASPTYRNIGDHSETIQIDYDSTQITYDQLLEFFWAGHSCSVQAPSRQYKSVIFYHNQQQKDTAQQSKQIQEQARGVSIVTEIESFDQFYLAEDYHQKYYLQQNRQIWNELRQVYPIMDDIIDSTAAARFNGYVGGYKTLEDLELILLQAGKK
jgi:peptide-methionine (S)-S-oxide reductase